MKLIVGFACTRTLLTLTKPTQHFAFSQQQSTGRGVYSRLSTFRFKACEDTGYVGYALFDATGTLMHLREPVGDTYSRYATMHGLKVGSPADLELRFKTTYMNTVSWDSSFCVSLIASMDSNATATAIFIFTAHTQYDPNGRRHSTTRSCVAMNQNK